MRAPDATGPWREGSDPPLITSQDYVRPASAVGDTRALCGCTLLDAAAAVARRSPDRVALVDGTEHLRWVDLLDRAARLACALRDAGVGKGEPVGIQMPNGWEFAAAHLALAQLGAVTATVHTPYGPAERTRLLEQIAAAHLITLAPQADGSRLPVLVDRSGDAVQTLWPPTSQVSLPASQAAPCDPLSIFFTSGTESPQPKVCLHSHDGLVSNALWVASDAPIAPDDVILSGSAFTHLFGTLALHLSLVTGARQVALDRFDALRFLQICAREGVTVAFLVPAHLVDLLRSVRETGVPAGLRLREIRVAGAHVPPGLVEEVRAELGASVVVHWGMSELGGGIYTHYLDPIEVAAGTIGRPTHGSAALIVDDDFRPVQAPGEVGELLFRGPSLFQGYYGASDVTRAAYIEVDGVHWLRTGDLAAWAEGGRIAYRGRKKDLINRGGMKVSAQEVESVVARMPGVLAAALVAEPDARLGERGCLFLRIEPGSRIALEQVQTHLAVERLARFKWPERVVVVDELPLTATGKVAKGTLRQWMYDRAPTA